MIHATANTVTLSGGVFTLANQGEYILATAPPRLGGKTYRLTADLERVIVHSPHPAAFGRGDTSVSLSDRKGLEYHRIPFLEKI